MLSKLEGYYIFTKEGKLFRYESLKDLSNDLSKHFELLKVEDYNTIGFDYTNESMDCSLDALKTENSKLVFTNNIDTLSTSDKQEVIQLFEGIVNQFNK